MSFGFNLFGRRNNRWNNRVDDNDCNNILHIQAVCAPICYFIGMAIVVLIIGVFWVYGKIRSLT
jgi:hypothetical protein